MYVSEQGPYQPPPEDTQSWFLRKEWVGVWIAVALVLIAWGAYLIGKASSGPVAEAPFIVEAPTEHPTEYMTDPPGDTREMIEMTPQDEDWNFTINLSTDPWLAQEASMYPDKVAELGRNTCDLLDQGAPVPYTISFLHKGHKYPEHQAGLFVTMAVWEYCPGHWDLLGEYAYGY